MKPSGREGQANLARTLTAESPKHTGCGSADCATLGLC